MNKLAIPAILVATVMVAGLFAFAPVEQASTVHQSGVNTSVRDSVSITFDDDFLILTGDAYVLMDFAGIGGTSDVEVVWRIFDANCDPATLTGAVVTDLVPDGAFNGVDDTLIHDDAAGVDAVLIVADAGQCDFQTGDFITVTVIGTG